MNPPSAGNSVDRTGFTKTIAAVPPPQPVEESIVPSKAVSEQPRTGQAITAGSGRVVASWLLLGLVCLGQFMVVLDISIVNVALPSIQAELRFTASGLQWVVNAYTLTFAGFLLLGDRAADLF